MHMSLLKARTCLVRAGSCQVRLARFHVVLKYIETICKVRSGARAGPYDMSRPIGFYGSVTFLESKTLTVTGKSNHTMLLMLGL